MKKGHGFCLYIDGDTTFPPDAILRLVQSAYGLTPQADIMADGYSSGATCLSPRLIPHGDVGVNLPRSGILEVMRTGGVRASSATRL